ncbi:hypothetical protein HRG_001351 [Hirsutella rhossiliensis]|uniref:Integrase zinc-binding domain-containing protein n=1 Tax=Hirsutella rhossiliensis TaxID=111463 RepID=A0A9P8N8K0_9HYPO|nr:uncharacterized protein HRG_01351 [Hirsutella rhossiliensis]KAH0968709.1 hypothetical protein HRG_01351 [Hirsutella rhossiliensis]
MDHDHLFSLGARNEFVEYLRANPNARRVSETDQINLIKWLIDATTYPDSQRESSRRHYVRKSFAWDAEKQALTSLPKGEQGSIRRVVTEDKIMDVVGAVHMGNGHAGWDATWKGISSNYYGILRADVIFLLKRCEVCAWDPRKRPKTRPSIAKLSDVATAATSKTLSLDDLIHSEPNPDIDQDADEPNEPNEPNE